MKTRIGVALTACLLVAGCGHGPPLKETSDVNFRVSTADPTVYLVVRNTDAYGLGTSTVPPVQQPSFYARVVMEYQPGIFDCPLDTKNCEQSKMIAQPMNVLTPDYNKDKRNDISRLFTGKKRSIVLDAKLSVNSIPGIETTVPLFSGSHNSTVSDGEDFTVEYTRNWVSPLIRVEPETVVSATYHVNRAQEVATGAISAALRVAKAAATQFVPGSQVLTTLNEEQLKKEAKVWDAAISKSFGSSVTENIQATDTIYNLRQGPGIGRRSYVTLRVPKNDDGNNPEGTAGTWHVFLTPPKFSLFTEHQCMAAPETCGGDTLKNVDPASVLSFRFAENVTLIESLRKTDWFARDSADVAVKREAEKARAFCDNVRLTLIKFGLTPVDATIALWAIVNGEPLPSGAAPILASGCQDKFFPFESQTPLRAPPSAKVRLTASENATAINRLAFKFAPGSARIGASRSDAATAGFLKGATSVTVSVGVDNDAEDARANDRLCISRYQAVRDYLLSVSDGSPLVVRPAECRRAAGRDDEILSAVVTK